MSGEAAPSKNPCGSCPYRRDVPSGGWAPEEYAKLPAYDSDTPYQPAAAFFCHQQNGRLCAGWVGCHDMHDNLALRMASLMGVIDIASAEAALSYETSVPLFDSGTDAMLHGLADVETPGEKAQKVVARLTKKLEG